MIENEYYEKIQKAESIADLHKIVKEIYAQICRESIIVGEQKTLLKVYTLATLVLKVFISRDW